MVSMGLRTLIPFPSVAGGGAVPATRRAVRELWNAEWSLPCSATPSSLSAPVLDHHAVVLGSCPKFRVTDPASLRAAVWDHAMQLLREGR